MHDTYENWRTSLEIAEQLEIDPALVRYVLAKLELVDSRAHATCEDPRRYSPSVAFVVQQATRKLSLVTVSSIIHSRDPNTDQPISTLLIATGPRQIQGGVPFIDCMYDGSIVETPITQQEIGPTWPA